MEWFIGIGWFASLWLVFELGKEVGFHRGIQAFASILKTPKPTIFIDPAIEADEGEEWKNGQIS